jgi:hypothetical protein
MRFQLIPVRLLVLRPVAEWSEVRGAKPDRNLEPPICLSVLLNQLFVNTAPVNKCLDMVAELGHAEEDFRGRVRI